MRAAYAPTEERNVGHCVSAIPTPVFTSAFREACQAVSGIGIGNPQYTRTRQRTQSTGVADEPEDEERNVG